MENAFNLNIEFNGKNYDIKIPQKADYQQFTENIKSQLEIQSEQYLFIFFLFKQSIVVQDQQTLIQWDEQSYLQERDQLYVQQRIPLSVIELKIQPPPQQVINQIKKKQYIEIPLNNQQYQYQNSSIIPKQLIQQGLYLKYYRNKQRVYYSNNVDEIQKIDDQDYAFSIMLILDFKYYEQYQFFNRDFLKFLNQIIWNQKLEYDWVQKQVKEFFFNRAIEIHDIEEKYQQYKNDAIQFEIIRQNRYRTYAHYNFFSQICQRYMLQDYQNIIKNKQNLKFNHQELYKNYILTFVNFYTKQSYIIDLNKDQQNALSEYFKSLIKIEIKSVEKFNSTLKLVIENLVYQPPIRDHNPKIGFSLDENIRIEDTLFELTKRWSIDGPFYDIHLTKQALYNAKYILFLYNKYQKKKTAQIIVESICYQLFCD